MFQILLGPHVSLFQLHAQPVAGFAASPCKTPLPVASAALFCLNARRAGFQAPVRVGQEARRSQVAIHGATVRPRGIPFSLLRRQSTVDASVPIKTPGINLSALLDTRNHLLPCHSLKRRRSSLPLGGSDRRGALVVTGVQRALGTGGRSVLITPVPHPFPTSPSVLEPATPPLAIHLVGSQKMKLTLSSDSLNGNRIPFCQRAPLPQASRKL